MSNILKHIPSSINKLHKDIIPIKSFGSWIIDKNNKKYLDLTSGIGALSTGHSHQKIIEYVKENISKQVHIPQQVFGSHPAQLELNEKLINIMPNKCLDNIFYVNSGSEATDNAIKIARRYTNKTNIISMFKGFHGRTLGALSITSSNTTCKNQLQPMIPGMFFCNDFSKESLDNILTYYSSPEETSAIILEPVQGESGIYSIPENFMKYVEKVCNENNIMFIADEVQCGAGRTGTWWNVEQKKVIPDIMTFGKGIASGFPLAGVISRSEIMNNLGSGMLGGTYGGNVISSLAASKTIDIIENENLLENTNEKGNYIFKELTKLNNIKEVRQYGLMIAIELDNSDVTNLIVTKLRENGILVLTAGVNNKYIRILPPLNISSDEIEYFISNIKTILNSL